MTRVVYLNDRGVDYDSAEQHFDAVADWARQNCASFCGHHVQDVSDVSYQYDFIAEYRFNDAQDAAWFELKWR
jgi:hypothetical protein